MAQKPDGKPAKTERVTFTRPAAERIAKVVREVEAGNRDQAGLTFGSRVTGLGGKTFRVCTFTGSWSINSAKTVTFKNQTTTPNTASAVNLFFPITATAAGGDCAIAKDGTAWYLIDVPMRTATAVFASSTATHSVYTALATTQRSVITSLGSPLTVTAISSITLSATLNTADCTITIAQTAQTQQFTVASGTPATQTITVLTGTPATTSITVMGSTYTAAFLTFG